MLIQLTETQLEAITQKAAEKAVSLYIDMEKLKAEPEALTVSDFCKASGKSERTIRRKISDGIIESFKMKGDLTRIPRTELRNM